MPEQVTVVTYHNYGFKCLIERCYESYGIENYVVLGGHVKDWDWGSKIQIVLDYLLSGVCSTQYILCTDANDVLMVNDPAFLLDRFRSYSCEILFCNTFVDFPICKVCRDFETFTYYTHPLHCRLSAGAYIAEREPLIGYLEKLVAAYQGREPWAMDEGVFTDQLGWRHLHVQHYPKLKVDFQSRIFKRYDLFMNYD